MRDSGLSQLNHQWASQQRYLRYLSMFLQNLNFIDELNKNPHYKDSLEIKSLYLLALIKAKKQISSYDISIRPMEESLRMLLSSKLIELYASIKTNTNIQIDFDFYELRDLLPEIIIHYSDYLLKNSIVNNKVFEQIQTINSPQKHRLLAFYYRRKGNKDLAKESLDKYKKYPLDPKAIKIKASKINQYYPPEIFLDNLGKIYEELNQIQEEIIIRTGIDTNTCFNNTCNDCCIKTPPKVSLLEFLYIAKNLNLKIYKERAEIIDDDSLQIIDDSDPYLSTNPKNLEFICPFLSNGACDIHLYRPLACRAYGLASIDGSNVQACNFYLKEYQSTTDEENSRELVDIRSLVSMLRRANEFISQTYSINNASASLPAWLRKFSKS